MVYTKSLENKPLPAIITSVIDAFSAYYEEAGIAGRGVISIKRPGNVSK